MADDPKFAVMRLRGGRLLSIGPDTDRLDNEPLAKQAALNAVKREPGGFFAIVEVVGIIGTETRTVYQPVREAAA